MSLQSCGNAFVDKAGVDHCHHFECLGISHTTAVNHLCGYVEPAAQTSRLLASAVNEHFGTRNAGEFVEEGCESLRIVDNISAYFIDFYHCQSDSRIRLSTTVAEISRLAASGMTMLCGDSITSSVTIMLRRTGRQCIK